MIIPVVMAGGSGTRLWPVSRDNYPKQFVAFHPGEPTLFQQTLLRLEGLEQLAPPIILTNEAHRFLVAEQLQGIGNNNAEIILEPLARNTAPALMLAALCARVNKQEKDVLLVLAADHLIQDITGFHQAIRIAEAEARSGTLVTFGLVPDRPETGYGYIRRAEAGEKACRVAEFVEKPDAQTAANYLASGDYFWNSGMFLFQAEVFIREMQNHAPEIVEASGKAFAGRSRDEVFGFWRIPEASFAANPSRSIDYALMEHTDKAMMVPLDVGWSDLGAWDALWDKSDKDAKGNVSRGDVILHEVSNSYIHASSRHVAVAGMEDAIVIETPDCILVTNKRSSQLVKELTQELKRQNRVEAEHHKLVRRPWGAYESLAEEPGFQVKRIVVKPGASLSLQLHHHRAEHWTVVKGEAKITKGNEVFVLRANESTYIPLETKHRLENTGDEELILIEVQCGDYLGEDDIVRFEDIYGRADQNEQKK